MIRFILSAIILITPAMAYSQSRISVPWEELKTLYKQSVERSILEKCKKKKPPYIFGFNEGRYRIKIEKNYITGTLSLSGKVISGKPVPIDLFDSTQLIVEDILDTQWGDLYCETGQNHRIVFLPTGQQPFRIDLAFSMPIQEDRRSRFVRLAIPPALKNTLTVDLNNDYRLIENPGTPKTDGSWRLSAGSDLFIRFTTKSALSGDSIIDVDMVTRVQIQGNKILMKAAFHPNRIPMSSFLIDVPENFRIMSSSLKTSWFTTIKPNLIDVHPPPDAKIPFYTEFISISSNSDKALMFSLPKIQGNTGSTDVFFIEQPDDGRVEAAEKGIILSASPDAIQPVFKDWVGKRRHLLKSLSGQQIQLNVSRFKPMHASPMVLDAVRLFSSFEENGNILSVLSMTLPLSDRARLALHAVADTKIWSLKVNGNRRKVYEDGSGSWIIPLDRNKASSIELAYIRKGDKLGLDGRLELTLPETGLSSRRLIIGVALPERVQLLSVEGPISPEINAPRSIPNEFIGKPHFFSRAFHDGSSLDLAVFYKEPVDPAK